MKIQNKHILVATRNRGKLAEIREILAAPDLELLSPEAVGNLPEVEEDGDTFEANAIKKAVTLARASGMLTLADDSGLEVDALGGEPGVYSARYAGEPSNDAANNAKLLASLLGETNRRGRFRCVIALATPDGECATVDGCCEGRIAEAPQGQGGFGYDPLFVPDGYTQSFGELEAAVKHRISHRGAALRAARKAWPLFNHARSGVSVTAPCEAGPT
jgi:XTP/dITP diphosphohydrolase